MAEENADPVLASVLAYSAHAEAYERRYAPSMLDRVERFGRSLHDSSSILGAGCGPGRDLARFAAMGHQVRGVELNPEFAAMAAGRAPVWQADLRQVTSLFPAAAFDGIWACSSLVHFTDVDTADVLRQFTMLTRPGGRLYASVNTVGETGWLDEPDGRRWYTIWEAATFAQTVASAGFSVDAVDTGPVVEVWATRGPRARPATRSRSRTLSPPRVRRCKCRCPGWWG